MKNDITNDELNLLIENGISPLILVSGNRMPAYNVSTQYNDKIDKKYIKYSIDIGGYDKFISYDNGNLNIELSYNSINSSIIDCEWDTIFNKISQKTIKLSMPLDNGFTIDDIIQYKNDTNILHIILSNNSVYKSRII